MRQMLQLKLALDQTHATIHNEDFVIHISLFILLHFMHLSLMFNLVFNETFNQKDNVKKLKKKLMCHQSSH
jgi:hypothetical protein